MKNIKKQYNVALLSAMPEEIGSTISKLKDLKITKYGELKIYSGLYYIEAESVTIKMATWERLVYSEWVANFTFVSMTATNFKKNTLLSCC